MRYHERPKGSKRTRTSFLWFPKKIKKETRWLETATWEDEWYTGMAPSGWLAFWMPMRWINP